MPEGWRARAPPDFEWRVEAGLSSGVGGAEHSTWQAQGYPADRKQDPELPLGGAVDQWGAGLPGAKATGS